jgi:hypothetical protein
MAENNTLIVWLEPEFDTEEAFGNMNGSNSLDSTTGKEHYVDVG